ncbi:hypothetical protein MKW92_048064 [Papaver armeniacum]|nr:hypothetical protein MKW92_048064 [Papaver armeniacum]
MADVSALKQNLAELLAQNFKDGTLGNQYKVCQSLRSDGDAWFIVLALELFCTETEKRFREVNEKHMKPYMDIPAIEIYVETIKSSSLCMGCDKLTQACCEYMQNSCANQIVGCHKAMMKLTHEFNRTKGVFQKIIELEREINILSGAGPQPAPPNYNCLTGEEVPIAPPTYNILTRAEVPPEYNSMTEAIAIPVTAASYFLTGTGAPSSPPTHNSFTGAGVTPAPPPTRNFLTGTRAPPSPPTHNSSTGAGVTPMPPPTRNFLTGARVPPVIPTDNFLTGDAPAPPSHNSLTGGRAMPAPPKNYYLTGARVIPAPPTHNSLTGARATPAPPKHNSMTGAGAPPLPTHNSSTGTPLAPPTPPTDNSWAGAPPTYNFLTTKKRARAPPA